MKKLMLFCFMASVASLANAQQILPGKTYKTLSASLTGGSSRGSVAIAYNYHWRLGKKQRFEIGLGIRNTTGFGTKQTYVTAPAPLARTNTIPFLIVFAGLKEANLDTLVVQRPLTTSLNAMVQLGYRFNSKWSGGFNIDLLGYTLGRQSAAILTSNGSSRTEPKSKPAAFNALLTGDLDLGSLNSEAFVQYQINNKWGIRTVYQFVFTEYKTSSISQIAPNGEEVTRFRQKANNIGIGLSYQF